MNGLLAVHIYWTRPFSSANSELFIHKIHNNPGDKRAYTSIAMMQWIAIARNDWNNK